MKKGYSTFKEPFVGVYKGKMIIHIYILELNNVYVKLFDHYAMYFS